MLLENIKRASLFKGCLSFLISFSAFAGELLPYSQRTHSYSGWNSSVHGDNRTIGMGGATVGLGDSFLASTENPSGLAMTLDGADLNFSNNAIQDGNLQNYLNPIYLSSFGAAVNHYPWGFSLGFFNTYREGQEYNLPSYGGRPATLETSISEFRLGVGRLVDIQNRALALGLALNFGTAEEAINGTPQQSSSLGLIGSGMLQLQNRVLIGLSYQLPMSYPVPSYLNSPILPGFYQTMKVPGRLALGLGWIPNRIFRAGASLSFIGQTPDTALLRDDKIAVGEYVTYQPRLGFAYTLADFAAIHSKVYAGSYLENTRIQDSGRLHATIGLEARFGFMTLGYGGDLSVNYINNSFSIGVDVIRMMSMWDLIPKEWHPPYAGLFPDPFEASDLGLVRPLVNDWVPRGTPLDPIQVGLEIPARMEKKFEEIRKEIGSLNLRTDKNTNVSEKKESPSTSQKTPKLKKKKQKQSQKKVAGPDSP